MTGTRRQFEGEWASGSGKAVIDVGILRTASGPKVSISSAEGWPEMLLTPLEAVRLADSVLTFAEPEAGGIAKHTDTGAGFGVTPKPDVKVWSLDVRALT